MLTDPDVIRVMLARLVAARRPVFAFFEGDDERYATSLLEIDAAAGALIVDELIPRHGHERMRRGAKLRFSTRLDGVEMRFRASVRAIDADGTVAAYMFDLPIALDHREQRAVLRTRTREVAAELRDADTATVHARVLDLSMGGLRLAVRTPHPLVDASEWDCTVVLPTCSFDTRIAITHVRRAAGRTHAGHHHEDVLGARFAALGSSAARRLGRYIAETQRALLRARRETTENRAP
jgi:c-di-GMP-binding flagellar brake protein YcgR